LRISFSRKCDGKRRIPFEREGGNLKKPYAKPAILHSVKIEARAVQCAKVTDACGVTGPLDS
jgi:hypothetical protein